ncbi:hypothetical protein PAXINDRAFT_17130 [Paxillus involutus ATCC 200175]|uniref:Uncharacterized protein n=1 Tax=Paxillus involutus ATCC 200175 TaxID=664439 RepID=A0A0C9TRJ7_PAXIN|nr:hypothetical protein PAXINDRAFT_17130 [Paxillus involutus ATCC 200175]
MNSTLVSTPSSTVPSASSKVSCITCPPALANRGSDLIMEIFAGAVDDTEEKVATIKAIKARGTVTKQMLVLEFENLLSQLCNLSISKDSQFFIAINPHIAYPLNSQPPSPSAKGIFRTPSDPVSGLLDPFSPAVPGAFVHSTPQRTLDRTTAPSPFSLPLTPLPSSAPSSPLPSLTALLHPLDSPLHSSPLPILTQPQPDITFLHVHTHAIAQIKRPPKFDSKSPAHLEDIEILAEAAQIKAAIRYADLNEAEVWQTLTAASSGDWDAFVIAIKDLYPGCKGADHYCCADLQYLVQDYCAKAMHSQDELGEYCRKFMKISVPLIANNKLADTEQDAFSLDGFPRAIANWNHLIPLLVTSMKSRSTGSIGLISSSPPAPPSTLKSFVQRSSSFAFAATGLFYLLSSTSITSAQSPYYYFSATQAPG